MTPFRWIVLLLLASACPYVPVIQDETPSLGAPFEVGPGAPAPDDTGAPPCDAETPVAVDLASFDANSMSIPVRVRLDVKHGASDLAAVNLAYTPIRPWEFFNYYQFEYPAPVDDDVTVRVEMVRGAVDEDAYTLQVAAVGVARSNWDRDLVNVTFVLDTSCSMNGDPLLRLQDAGYAVASSLRAGDVVSMVTWSQSSAAILDSHVVVGPNDPVVVAAFGSMHIEGDADLSAALRAGYALTGKNWSSERINRVFLVTDGGAILSTPDEELIATKASDDDAERVYLVGVGVGSGSSYGELLVDRAADLGKGASVYLGGPGEADRVFGPDRFVELVDIAARDVSVRLEVPPGFEIERLSGEGVSDASMAIAPQDLAADDTMVFFQTLRTCAPLLVEDGSPLSVIVTWRDATTLEPKETRLDTTFGALLSAGTDQLRKGVAILAYTEALRAVKERSGGADVVVAALDALALADGEGPGDPDLAEIRGVLDRL